MKCPSCGFENIPGRTACGVCDASLAQDEALSIYPPRARDRTMRQRAEWFHQRRVENSAPAVAFRRARDGFRSLRETWAPGFGLHEVVTVLASVLPGLGYLLVWKDRPAARRHMLAALAMLLAAALLYRTPLSNVLVLGAVGLSMFSVATAVEGMRGPVAPALAERRMMATLLLTLAAYAGVTAILVIVLQPFWMVATVTQPGPATPVRAGDRILISNRNDVRRGDVVMGNGEVFPYVLFGPVIAMSGETVTLMPDGRIYVDNRLARVRMEAVETRGMGQVFLNPGEVWVAPNMQVRVYEDDGRAEQQVARSGVTSVATVRRAVAVLGPPWHRRRIARQHIFGEGN